MQIEIDGKKIEANPGEMIIAAADRNDVYIPRFCYHKKLSIAANCRMCLVEVEGQRKTMPACATPVMDKMVVHTNSPTALHSQRAVMEFLLINHPLDCPICDQGGECELQDLAMGYGEGVSQYTEGKRTIKDKNLGPLISSDMTRCIYCTRCVRFGKEVAGLQELGAMGRGEHSEIGTYIERAVESEMSGNVVDLCPVGALTNKPYRYHGRAWEMRQHEAVAPHDCVGSNIYLHSRGEEYSHTRSIRRVVPRENEAINETWIADRDRYGVYGLQSKNRLTKPMIKRDGRWEEVDWQDALNFAVAGLKKLNPEKIAAVASPSSTTEEFYLLQKLMRGLGCHSIDHRLHETDFSDQDSRQHFPGLQIKIADIENLDAALLIGSNLRHEQPSLNTRLRKITLNNKSVAAINPVDYDFNYSFSTKIIAAGNHLIHELAAVANALGLNKKMVADVAVNEQHKAIAEQLKSADNAAIFLGAYANHHPYAATIRSLAQAIAKATGASLNELTDGANTAGAWLTGCVPHRGVAGSEITTSGLDAAAMFAEKLSGYVIVNLEPENDAINPGDVISALESADIVVMMTPFITDAMRQYADVLLPMAAFSENDGHFVNVAGQQQFNRAVTLPLGEAKPGWKVLRVLGNLFELDDFDYTSVDQVSAEFHEQLKTMTSAKAADFTVDSLPSISNTLQRIGSWPINCIDNIVRESECLQAAMPDKITALRVNADLATSLQINDGQTLAIKQNNATIELPVMIDNTVPDYFVVLPMGCKHTAGFGAGFSEIELTRGGEGA